MQARGSMYSSRSHSPPSATGPTIRRKPPFVDVRITRSVGRQGRRSHPGLVKPTRRAQDGTACHRKATRNRETAQSPEPSSPPPTTIPTSAGPFGYTPPIGTRVADGFRFPDFQCGPRGGIHPLVERAHVRFAAFKDPWGTLSWWFEGTTSSTQCREDVGKMWAKRDGGRSPPGETAPDQRRSGS